MWASLTSFQHFSVGNLSCSIFFSIEENTVIKISMQKSWFSFLIILLGVIPKGRITGQKLLIFEKPFVHLITGTSKALMPSHQNGSPCLFAALPILTVTGCKGHFPFLGDQSGTLGFTLILSDYYRGSIFPYISFSSAFLFCDLLL